MAVTQYQVLSSTLSSALLELQPVTGEGAGVLQWEAAPVRLRTVLGPVLGSALLHSCIVGAEIAAASFESFWCISEAESSNRDHC